MFVPVSLNVFFNDLFLEVVVVFVEAVFPVVHPMDVDFEPSLLPLLVSFALIPSRDFEAFIFFLVELFQMFLGVVELVGRVTKGVFVHVKVVKAIIAVILVVHWLGIEATAEPSETFRTAAKRWQVVKFRELAFAFGRCRCFLTCILGCLSLVFLGSVLL